jgi:hypothetical protein
VVVLVSRKTQDEALSKLREECARFDMTVEVKPDSEKQDEATDTLMKLMQTLSDKVSMSSK